MSQPSWPALSCTKSGLSLGHTNTPAAWEGSDKLREKYILNSKMNGLRTKAERQKKGDTEGERQFILDMLHNMWSTVWLKHSNLNIQSLRYIEWIDLSWFQTWYRSVSTDAGHGGKLNYLSLKNSTQSDMCMQCIWSTTDSWKALCTELNSSVASCSGYMVPLT